MRESGARGNQQPRYETVWHDGIQGNMHQTLWAVNQAGAVGRYGGHIHKAGIRIRRRNGPSCNTFLMLLYLNSGLLRGLH